MVWSHNGTWMVTTDDRGFVKYWQSNFNNVHTFQAHSDPVKCSRLEVYSQASFKHQIHPVQFFSRCDTSIIFIIIMSVSMIEEWLMMIMLDKFIVIPSSMNMHSIIVLMHGSLVWYDNLA